VGGRKRFLAAFIHAQPDGFEHPIRERGSGLSTGQKQFISFARALAHNPRFLILDEATSSVDTETEFRVREALSRMVEGRTSIVLAHRLSTIQRADRILVMHKGGCGRWGRTSSYWRCAAFIGSCINCSIRTRKWPCECWADFPACALDGQAAGRRLVAITDRFAGFEAQSLNVHVDLPLFQRMALPVMAGKTKSPASIKPSSPPSACPPPHTPSPNFATTCAR
jgi:energy-coupling factor transporter ATP-binding protein EcfA2